MDARELKRRFGRRVQGLREAAKLTQDQLAERIGRSVDTVGNIERGINATRIEVADAIAVALGVRFGDLYALDDAPEPEPAERARDQAVASLLDLLKDRDAETIQAATDLVRAGLRLAR